MKTLLKGSEIEIQWRVIRGINKNSERFMDADLRVFLIGSDKKVIPHKIVRDGMYDVISLIIPNDLQTGVYDLKAIWIKNRNTVSNIVPTLQYRSESVKTGVFAVTDSPSEVTCECDSIVLMSYVDGFGRDGMSAYEIAVFRGLTLLSEKDWISSIYSSLSFYGSYPSDGHTIDYTTLVKLPNGRVVYDPISRMFCMTDFSGSSPAKGSVYYAIFEGSVRYNTNSTANIANIYYNYEDGSFYYLDHDYILCRMDSLREGSVSSTHIASGVVSMDKLKDNTISKLSASSLRFDGFVDYIESNWNINHSKITELGDSMMLMFVKGIGFAYVEGFVNGRPTINVSINPNFSISESELCTSMYCYDVDVKKNYVTPSGKHYTWNDEGTELILSGENASAELSELKSQVLAIQTGAKATISIKPNIVEAGVSTAVVITAQFIPDTLSVDGIKIVGNSELSSGIENKLSYTNSYLLGSEGKIFTAKATYKGLEFTAQGTLYGRHATYVGHGQTYHEILKPSNKRLVTSAIGINYEATPSEYSYYFLAVPEGVAKPNKFIMGNNEAITISENVVIGSVEYTIYRSFNSLNYINILTN